MSSDYKVSRNSGRVLSMVAFVSLAACSRSSEVAGPSTSASVVTVTVAPAPATIPPGGYVQLAATLKDASGNALAGRSVTWSSSSTGVAAVDQTGRVSGVANGTVTITATSEGRSGTAPVTVKPIPLGTIVTLVTGFRAACAINLTGAAFCWGYGGSGAIGDGSLASRSTPTLVGGGLTFATVATSSTHSCGVITSGIGYCWGSTYGVGSRSGQSVLLNPVPVFETVLASVGTGQQFSCGLTPTGGAYCWGDNARELGAGRADVAGGSRVPVAVAGGRAFKSLSVGFRFACGVTDASAAFCWGEGTKGELGNGAGADASAPEPVSGGLNFTSMAAGESTTCGLISSGTAYCWGSGSSGQIGDGSNTQRLTPASVSGGLSFKSISAGFTHTCGITTSGSAYCWGDNVVGALGDGTFASTNVPIPVSGGLTFSSISSADSFTCGLTTGNVAYCWGKNDAGQLGNGSTAASNVPLRVADQQ